MKELRKDIAFLTSSPIQLVKEEELAYFEREIMNLFRKRPISNMKNEPLNGTYFEETLIPLLKRIDGGYVSEERTRESVLCGHVGWLKEGNVSEVIEGLFGCLQCLHRGEMGTARSLIQKIEDGLKVGSNA